MRRYRRFWGALLAAIMLVSTIPAAYAADKDGPSAPGLAALATDPNNTPSGLNGKTGSNDNFDYSKYDEVIDIYDIVSEISAEGHWYTPVEDFEWPDGTTFLLVVSHNSDKEILDYLDIPDGKIVDVYDFGGWLDENYTCWAHYDTTDGESTQPSQPVEQPTEQPSKPVEQPTKQPSTPSTSGNYSSNFTDVQPGAWYYDAVMTMADNGILAGYGNGKFGPDDPITYQQLWTILDRICNYGDRWTKNGQDEWSTRTVTRAGAAYYMAGARWSARLNEGHSYYDIVIQNRADHYMNGTFTNTIDEFPDADKIRAYTVEFATDYVNDHPDELETVTHLSEMVQKAIVNARNYDFFAGVDNAGTFSADTPLTRAQLCQALWRAGVYDKVG